MVLILILQWLRREFYECVFGGGLLYWDWFDEEVVVRLLTFDVIKWRDEDGVLRRRTYRLNVHDERFLVSAVGHDEKRGLRKVKRNSSIIVVKGKGRRVRESMETI